MLTAPPLSLYIHIPWCVQKCPYCDFNSHTFRKSNGQHDIPEAEYVAALIADLDTDINHHQLNGRKLHSIFIGGGTPSLFSAEAISSLLTQVLARFEQNCDIEITLEANPGTVEAQKFQGFSDAGVNRLSIGVQSFASDKLIKLGRIHDSEQAIKAATYAKQAGINSFNLDLMHGLPNQSIENALDDLKTAISLKPNHLSWYQLTIEPNTPFYAKPPTLPEDDILWQIQDSGLALLEQAGYQQYEVSAFSQANTQCQHNLNYWRFGDYLGIGCGAHGKITKPEDGKIYRTVKAKQPQTYLSAQRDFLVNETVVSNDELPFEFMMNRLRLFEAFSDSDFEKTTGLNINEIRQQLTQAVYKQLLHQNGNQWQVSTHGHRYLNSLLEMFLS